MIKLNSLISTLQEYQLKVEEELNNCDEKLAFIEDNAENKKRDLNTTENEKVSDLDLEISELQEEADAIEYAISDLEQFCD